LNKKISATVWRKKAHFTVATILMLSISAIAVATGSSAQVSAYDTPTPSYWRELLTETAGGAYREPPGVTDYPVIASPGYVPSMTGYSAGPGPATNHLLWRSRVPMGDWHLILANNGKIFASSGVDNCIYALDELTGEVIWVRNGSSLARWSVLDDNYIFTAEGGFPVAISQNTGEIRWKAPIRGVTYGIAPWGEVFHDGTAIFTYDSGRSPGNTTCYKVTRGGSITRVWTNDTVQGRLGYANGRLYGVLEYNQWVSCVNASTGFLIWNYTSTDPAHRFYPAPTIAYGNVYLGTERPAGSQIEFFDNVVCVDAITGTYKWTYKTQEYFVQSISAAYGNIYIAGGDRNAVHCVDGVTGQKKWEYNAPGFIDYYDIAIADGKLYFPSAAIKVEGFPPAGTFPSSANCINATTGELIWSYRVPTSASAPAPIVDGKYLFHSYCDYLWCFGKGPTTTSITVATASLIMGQTACISGSIADMSPFSQQYPELQNPWVKGASVVLCYLKDGEWYDFATVQTDDQGQFIYEWAPKSAGVYTVYARFEGNEAYHWSSAKTVVQVCAAPEASPTPTPEPTQTPTIVPTPTASPSVVPEPEAPPNMDIYIIAVAATVIIVVAAAAVFLKKRK